MAGITMSEEKADSPKTWLALIFREIFRLIHNHEQDNFDDFRFPEAQRNTFFYEMHAAYLGILIENADAFHSARNLLADQASRDLFDSLILFRLLGHLHVRLPLKNHAALHGRHISAEWKIDETGDLGAFGPLSIFAVPYKGSEVWVKCGASNVAATFLSGQYHFERD